MYSDIATLAMPRRIESRVGCGREKLEKVHLRINFMLPSRKRSGVFKMLNQKRVGMGLFSTVFLILLIMKLTGLIVISWWWVFAPLVASVCLGIIFMMICFFIAMILWLCDDVMKVNKKRNWE